jgi:membrane protease YdiL (CAAX protease family)
MIERYRHPFRFYLLSAALPWTLWLGAAWLSHRPGTAPGIYITSLGLAGLCAPVGIAIYYAWKDQALRDVTRRFFNFRSAPAGYFVLSLVLMPASIILAMAISIFFGYPTSQFVISGHASFSSGVLPVWFILVMAPIVEELAWHSYGTDCLRQRFNLFNTSIIFAVYWALWHVPLAMIKGYYHANLVVEGALYSINFLVSLFPFVFLMNWLYYRTDRNILVAVVLHLTANLSNELFATDPDSKVIQTGLLLALSAAVIVRERMMFFQQAFSGSGRAAA